LISAEIIIALERVCRPTVIRRTVNRRFHCTVHGRASAAAASASTAVMHVAGVISSDRSHADRAG